MSPLYIASLNGHVEAVRALVELGAAASQADVGCWDVYVVCHRSPLQARLCVDAYC
jgi:hypothetical protein